MKKEWRSVAVQRELLEEVEKNLKESPYKSLSEFVSESIQQRLQTLSREKVAEYLERDTYTRFTPQLQEKVFYTPKHIWAKLTPQGNVQIGVTDYLNKKCHGIVDLETVEVGEKISEGEPFALAETPSWWVLYDLYCPIDGVIVKYNNKIINDPLELLEDPFQWVVEVQPNDPNLYKKLPELLTLEEYTELTATLEDRSIPIHAPSEPEIDEIIKKIRH